MLKVLDVDGAVRRVSGGWEATGRDWAYDADRYARVSAERAREQRAMLGYISAAPAGWNTCGASSTTRRPRRAGGATTARAALERRGFRGGHCRCPRPAAAARGGDHAAEDVADRDEGTGRRRVRQDPGGRVGGARPGAGQADRSRLGPAAALAAGRRRARRAGSRGVRRGAGQGAGRLGLGPAACRGDDAAVQNQARADRSLGERIAEIGRLPYLGALEYADGARPADDLRPAARQYNSAHRLRALWHSLAVPSRSAAR